MWLYDVFDLIVAWLDMTGGGGSIYAYFYVLKSAKIQAGFLSWLVFVELPEFFYSATHLFYSNCYIIMVNRSLENHHVANAVHFALYIYFNGCARKKWLKFFDWYFRLPSFSLACFLTGSSDQMKKINMFSFLKIEQI